MTYPRSYSYRVTELVFDSSSVRSRACTLNQDVFCNLSAVTKKRDFWGGGREVT